MVRGLRETVLTRKHFCRMLKKAIQPSVRRDRFQRRRIRQSDVSPFTFYFSRFLKITFQHPATGAGTKPA